MQGCLENCRIDIVEEKCDCLPFSWRHRIYERKKSANQIVFCTANHYKNCWNESFEAVKKNCPTRCKLLCVYQKFQWTNSRSIKTGSSYDSICQEKVERGYYCADSTGKNTVYSEKYYGIAPIPQVKK